VDESVAGSGVTATKEARVEREVAPLEGAELQPSTLATSTACVVILSVVPFCDVAKGPRRT